MYVPSPSSHSQVHTADAAFARQLFLILHLVAPKPRAVLPSEKTYITSTPSEPVPSEPRQLPCWYDRWLAERHVSERQRRRSNSTALADPDTPDGGGIEPAELCLSVVFPAYNEEERIVPTLDEAVDWLDEHIGRPGQTGKTADGRTDNKASGKNGKSSGSLGRQHGYEIIIVNDGSTDATVDVVLDLAARRGLHDVLRVVSLEANRGKGGGVTHGLRHARGQYVLFADADGASRFADVARLMEGCDEVADASHRGVAIGSRAHLVGSEAVVKASTLSVPASTASNPLD